MAKMDNKYKNLTEATSLIVKEDCYDRIKTVFQDKTPPNVPDYENDLAFEPKNEKLPDIKIGQNLQILVGDEILDLECVSIHTNECCSVKETCFMTKGSNTFGDDEIHVSITYRKKKGA